MWNGLRSRRIDALLGLALVVTWSSGYVGAELGTRAASGLTLLAWRFIVAAAVLGLFTIAVEWWRRRASQAGLTGGMVVRRVRPPSDHTNRSVRIWQHGAIALLTQVGFVGGVVAAAAYGVPAGANALITCLQPIVGAILATRLLGESVRVGAVVGLALGLVGVGLVIGGDLRAGSGTPVLAYGLPLFSMLSLVSGTALERRLRPAGTMLSGQRIQLAVSALAFAGAAAATGNLIPPADPAFWLAVGWVVVLSTFAAYGAYWGVTARSGLTGVSGLLYLVPPVTAVWAWLMFGQQMTAMTVAGLLVAGSAVGLIIRGRRLDDRAAPAVTAAVTAAVDVSAYPAPSLVEDTSRATLRK